jgi:hypothetical protein
VLFRFLELHPANAKIEIHALRGCLAAECARNGEKVGSRELQARLVGALGTLVLMRLIALRDTTVVKRYWGHVWAIKNVSSAETSTTATDGTLTKPAEIEDADLKQSRSTEKNDAGSPDGRGSHGSSREVDQEDWLSSPLGPPRSERAAPGPRAAEPAGRRKRRYVEEAPAAEKPIYHEPKRKASRAQRIIFPKN